jgi:primosomal protein N' (replication factor Y) (superfamily II helicase)
VNQPPAEQLTLLKAQVRRTRPRPADTLAPERPYARVLVDVPLAHLDRPFDYSVPARMHDEAVPGARVKVRFSGRDVDGYLLDRLDKTSHPGRISPLRKVVSPEPVLSPPVYATARAVADRYAGTVSDVLRLAIPPRHARVEQEESPYSVVTPGRADHSGGLVGPVPGRRCVPPAADRCRTAPGGLDRSAG